MFCFNKGLFVSITDYVLSITILVKNDHKSRTWSLFWILDFHSIFPTVYQTINIIIESYQIGFGKQFILKIRKADIKLT